MDPPGMTLDRRLSTGPSWLFPVGDPAVIARGRSSRRTSCRSWASEIKMLQKRAFHLSLSGQHRFDTPMQWR